MDDGIMLPALVSLEVFQLPCMDRGHGGFCYHRMLIFCYLIVTVHWDVYMHYFGYINIPYVYS